MTRTELDDARDRYRTEREKRLRPDGNSQYVPLSGAFAGFDQDPFSDPAFTRPPVDEDVEVLVLGGGFAGMLTAINLAKAGITDVRIVDRAGDFGGTWYWNRYPGCMCDVEAYTYLPLLEETGYMPTERYTSAVEIFSYCQLLARTFGLYERALFQTEVVDAAWDDAGKRWVVTTDRDDRLRARFFVAAGGILHKPKLPGIPGIEQFQGTAFHASRWRYDLTGGEPTTKHPAMDGLRGKRVGIVGTGATAVQAVPELATYADELLVFQRTPSAVGQRDNRPTDPEWFRQLEPGWHEKRVRNFTQAVTGQQPAEDLVGDGWTHVMWVNTQRATDDPAERAALEQSDFETMEEIRARVDRIVDDPATAAALKPWYAKSCKRVCFHDEYLQTFNLPNVRLVDTAGAGVERITADGVVAGGAEHPVDVLIFASGFEVNSDLTDRLGFDPVGRAGRRLSERWSDGAHTLHGVLSHEFPNLLLIGLVQAGFGTNFLHFLSESAKHVAWLVAACEAQGITSIEPEPNAEEAWLGVLYGVAAGLIAYSAACTPGFYNFEQAPDRKAARNLVYAGSLLDYAQHLVAWREAGDFAGAVLTRGR